jgi:hypothetical protein
MKGLLLFSSLFLLCAVTASADPIDRHAVVARHDVVLTNFDATNPLSVGNGGFCFTVDATGLQTFSDAFTDTTPLGTLSDWGWHTFPNPHNWSIDTFQFTDFSDLYGRPVPYADVPHNKTTPEISWLRENPHRLDLGRIGFVLKHADGSPASPADLTDVRQVLDLWNGRIFSHFKFDGEPVDVETLCTPDNDGIAVHVVSPLAADGQLAIEIAFPYGTGEMKTADWDHPDAHQTILSQPDATHAGFYRRLDDDTYDVTARWSDGATLTNVAKHTFEVLPTPHGDELDLACAFWSPSADIQPLPTFAQAEKATWKHWNHFWKIGGIIDLYGSKDPRWFELERRIVLSQYLTAIQDAGQYPPAETGLTYNSWEGKYHMEMYFWHEAHFALWDRLPLLEKSMGWYQQILPRAQATAQKQGYAGARWPKMTSPSGAESPSPVGPFLVWEEPHAIMMAELCYRDHRDRATLEQYSNIVFQTAEFMANYAAWDTNEMHYVLGPIIQSAQEVYPKDRTFNPTFELAYWHWGLQTAQEWRERLGLPRDPKWDDVLQKLAPYPIAQEKFLFTETTPDSYTNPKWRHDHPAVLGAYSYIAADGIDEDTMSNTFDWVWNNWDWPTTWGWDYPLMAMTAARLGEPDRAIDALLLDTPKNHYGLNGQVYQRPDLSIYLPANGGLLYAAALMAAGWDGGPVSNAPGFPDNGQWVVRWEDLQRAP